MNGEDEKMEVSNTIYDKFLSFLAFINSFLYTICKLYNKLYNND